MTSNDIHIGTAGYSYSHWRKGVFYPSVGVTQSQELRYYSGVFPAVEINASFHAVPREETLKTWALNSKDGFKFSFKVPQQITHEKRLINIEKDLEYFLDRLLSTIKASLGPILFQLPPSLPKDINKLLYLSKLIPEGVKVAFEFRHKSWYSAEVYDVMRNCNFGLCDNISPDGSKLRVATTDDASTAQTWHYIRCHKRGDQAITNYADSQLSKIADALIERRNQNIVQYCYFLNDHEGNGPRNAKKLIDLIKEKSSNQNFVENWKPEPVAPSISSLFAKSASANKTTSRITSSSRFQPAKAKQETRSIDSFFSPSSNQGDISSPAAKRMKISNDTINNASKAKKGSITRFFQKKT